jgi:DNA primase catalytic subunit
MVGCMSRYIFPEGMRYATLMERKQFYTEEFDPKKVFEWFPGGGDNTKFAVIIGRHTKIFPRQYRHEASTTILLDKFKDFEKLQCQVLEFLPEAIYYDRYLYDANDRKVGQEVAFDLDPENVTCPIHGRLEDKMKRQQGLSFCKLEFDIIKKEALELYDFLEKRFKNLRVVYSGRGFHLHVFDEEAYELTAQERIELAHQVKDTGFHIDEWVTSGEYRLIRLPYSLNGLVSRIVLPIKKAELESFDAVHDKRCLPKFVAKEVL